MMNDRSIASSLADAKAIHLSSMTSLAGSRNGKTTAAGHSSVLCEFQGPNFAYTERIYFAPEEIVDPVSMMVGKNATQIAINLSSSELSLILKIRLSAVNDIRN